MANNELATNMSFNNYPMQNRVAREKVSFKSLALNSCSIAIPHAKLAEI